MRARRFMIVIATLAVAGCGSSQTAGVSTQRGDVAGGSQALKAHPQVIQPVAGVGGDSASGNSQQPAVVSVGGNSGSLPQPVSDAQVRRELAASGLSANTGQAQLTPSGLAIAPVDAPPAVQAIIQAGNEIAHLPYIWGGGHGRYIDNGYDCSGSISFVFAAAGLLNTTVTSGELVNWGAPGPGKWITIFANAGHTFMYIAGLRFDTVALAETGTRWSNRSADESNLGSYAVRHPVGL